MAPCRPLVSWLVASAGCLRREVEKLYTMGTLPGGQVMNWYGDVARAEVVLPVNLYQPRVKAR